MVIAPDLWNTWVSILNCSLYLNSILNFFNKIKKVSKNVIHSRRVLKGKLLLKFKNIFNLRIKQKRLNILTVNK